MIKTSSVSLVIICSARWGLNGNVCVIITRYTDANDVIWTQSTSLVKRLSLKLPSPIQPLNICARHSWGVNFDIALEPARCNSSGETSGRMSVVIVVRLLFVDIVTAAIYALSTIRKIVRNATSRSTVSVVGNVITVQRTALSPCVQILDNEGPGVHVLIVAVRNYVIDATYEWQEHTVFVVVVTTLSPVTRMFRGVPSKHADLLIGCKNISALYYSTNISMRIQIYGWVKNIASKIGSENVLMDSMRTKTLSSSIWAETCMVIHLVGNTTSWAQIELAIICKTTTTRLYK